MSERALDTLARECGIEAEYRDARGVVHVVADETAGQAIPLLFLPAAAAITPGRAAISLAVAFVLFRLMDIIKPFPANRIQSLPGGWGIVMDDLIAGVIASARGPVGSPPPPLPAGAMRVQNMEWLTCPPALFRTGPRLSSGSSASFLITSTGSASAHLVPSRALFAFVM